MGYPMAVNLRTKMPADHVLIICDISEASIDRFRKEVEGKGPVQVVKTGCDAVQSAVSI